MRKKGNGSIRRIAQRRKRPQPSEISPATVAIFTRFVRLNPWLSADSPILPNVMRAYDHYVGSSDA